MIYITSAIVGIVSSIIASFIYQNFYLAKLLPKVEISQYITLETQDGETKYWFKFVNKTANPIYDVKVNAYFITPEGIAGGQNYRIKNIDLPYTTYLQIPHETRNDNHALHAVQVRCNDDIRNMWTNSSTFVRFEIIAKHEISGFSKSFVKDYFDRTSVVEGRFEFGNNLGVV